MMIIIGGSKHDVEFSVGSSHVKGAIPNFATEKEQKRNFLDFTDVTLVEGDIKF